MRVSAALLAIPALAAAQEQLPLLGYVQPYLDKAMDFGKSLSGQSTTGGSQTTPTSAVTEFTLNNWESTLRWGGNKPAGSIEPWMIYVTGNKTCLGDCKRTDAAWDEAVVLLSESPAGPNLAILDCDRQTLLCGAWGASTGTIWYYRIPKPAGDQSTGPSALTFHNLNATTVTSSDITRIHTAKEYENQTPYDGIMHPLDGAIKQFGAQFPLAWFLFAMSKIPSPLFMIGLSFFSRYFVNRRMPSGQAQQAPAGAVPASAARVKKTK